MSKKRADILVIPEGAVPNFPPGVQAYVWTYFKKVTFLGGAYLVALGVAEAVESKDACSEGAAPKSFDHKNYFQDGLNAGVTPYSWLKDRATSPNCQDVRYINPVWDVEVERND